MTKTRLVLPVLAALAALAILAGCGGDSGSSEDPASVAPAETPVFVEAKIRPTGTLRENLEGIASRVAGIDDLGGTIIGYLEQSATSSDEPLDYEKEIEPWLGQNAGVFLTDFNGSDFKGNGVAVAVTDTGEAQEFIDKRVKAEGESPPEDASYEGVDYKLDPSDGSAIGIVGDFVVYGSEESVFKEAVDASNGDSLADSESYGSITPPAPESTLANVYVDIAGVIKAAGSQVDPEALRFFEATGIELEKSSALLSLVPGSDNVEVDVAAKLGEKATEDLAAKPNQDLLGSMPAGAVAAVGVGDVGESLGSAIDSIDENGIPGQIPAGRFKSTLKQAGIDLEKIASSLGDAAVFVQGRTRATLGGALVIEAKNPTEAKNTVSNIGTLLRASHTPGVTAVSGEAAGFSVHSRELGRHPVVVAAKGDRIAIGYGLAPTVAGLNSGSGPTLSKTKAYNEALNALGGTPIAGFAAGAPALRLVEGLLTETGEKEELEQLTPYLSKVPFLAVGQELNGDIAQAKLILGVTE